MRFENWKCLVLLFCLFPAYLISQEENQSLTWLNSLLSKEILSASSRVGFAGTHEDIEGVSVQRYLGYNFWLELNHFYYESESGDDFEKDVNAGIELQYDLKRTDNFRFYLLGSYKYLLRMKGDTWVDYDQNDKVVYEDYTSTMQTYNTAFAFGIEFKLFKHLVIGIETGVHNSNLVNNSTIASLKRYDLNYLGLCGSGGIYYAF